MTQIIADVGANHDRDMNKALEYVKICKECGVDVVKFQTYSADTMYSKYSRDVGGVNNPYDLIKNVSLPREWQKDIKQYADEIGIEFMSTPFDYDAVDELLDIGVKRFKISSFESVDKMFVKYIAKKNLPMIISTGLCSLDEILEIYDWVREESTNDLIFLHCMSSYPTPLEHANVSAIEQIYNFLDVKRDIYKEYSENKIFTEVGYSDHTSGISAPISSIAWQDPFLLEKHITIDLGASGPDHGLHAATPDEMKLLVSIKNLIVNRNDIIQKNEESYPFLSEHERNITVEEKFADARRSVVAKRDIGKNEIITWEDVSTKRPRTGIPSEMIELVVGKKLLVDLRKDEIIMEYMIDGF